MFVTRSLSQHVRICFYFLYFFHNWIRPEYKPVRYAYSNFIYKTCKSTGTQEQQDSKTSFFSSTIDGIILSCF